MKERAQNSSSQLSRLLGTAGNNLMDRFALMAPKRVVGFAGHLLFWPIACTQFLMYKLGMLQWYSEVFRHPSGGRVILGGLPWPESTRKLLLDKEHVTAVVNVVSEHNMPFKTQSRLNVPMMDFAHPEYSQVLPAVDFIDKHVKAGETVYVHCRAGKGRSATVVMCWLVGRMQMDPETAQEFLSRHRPQILDSLKDRDVVKQFYTQKRSPSSPS